MSCAFSRRHFLATAAGALLAPRPARCSDPPTSPVALARCPDYGAALLPTLETMFDQLGGLGQLVKDKTVAIKLNLTGSPAQRLDDSPVELAQWVHQDLIGAVVYLIGRAGARRIRLLEGVQDSIEPLQSFMAKAGWDPQVFSSAAPVVEFENTNYLGSGDRYSRLMVPFGGWLYPGFDVNHSYEDCDVFVSLAKLKQHATAGITLSIKNLYGILPTSTYGNGAGIDEPLELAKGNRGDFGHFGTRGPSKSAPQELDPQTPRDPGYRMPRIITELADARPIHLAIIDGIESMAGGEGPWIKDVRRVSPRVLIAGLNPVTTDAVATAVMGFDPMTPGGEMPFLNCDNTLFFVDGIGLGTRDLSRIEVIGTPIAEAIFPFASLREGD